MKALVLCLAVLIAAFLFACEREERRFSETAPANSRVALSPADFQPGPAVSPPPETKSVAAASTNRTGPYGENAWAVSEGKRLFTWYNCAGCHAHGGGGMGPALMDDKWIYGSAPEKIHQTIVEGRPNGMPAFGGRIPDQQVWQLVAYVRSMSGLLRKDVRSTRSDHMAARPSEQATEPAEPTSGGTTPPGVELP